MKSEKTVDLEVIDIEEGTGEFQGGLGALICISRDKIINFGTGIT